MAENSKIEWTDNTFNPWMGCAKVSPACKHCYAERDFDHRYKKVKWGDRGTRVMTSDASWAKPIKWNRDAAHTLLKLTREGKFTDWERPKVFCASLADVFEDWEGSILDHRGEQLIVPKNGELQFLAGSLPESDYRTAAMSDLRSRLFTLIDDTPSLIWLLLTKRPENVLAMWDGKIRENVWLGTSIENQEWADKRIPHLHEMKRQGFVHTTFVSAEPLLGPITLEGFFGTDEHRMYLRDHSVDWVIAGGESGPHARPSNTGWYRSLRDQCDMQGTPFLFKQWGEWGPRSLHMNEHLTGQDQFLEFKAGDMEYQEDFTQVRWGKKKAGRLLDGITHDGRPK